MVDDCGQHEGELNCLMIPLRMFSFAKYQLLIIINVPMTTLFNKKQLCKKQYGVIFLLQ